MSSYYHSVYPQNDLIFLRAKPYQHAIWRDHYEELINVVEEDLSVSFLANFSDTGRLRIGSVIDHAKHPNLGFQILQCKQQRTIMGSGYWECSPVSHRMKKYNLGALQ